MAKLNRKAKAIRKEVEEEVISRTHEGAPAHSMSDAQALRRSVMACLLWEGTFYESGVEIAQRIEGLVQKVHPTMAAQTAIESRRDYKLRHVPLWMTSAMLKSPAHKALVDRVLPVICQRPDEMGEFLKMYRMQSPKGKLKLANRVKRGLAQAFLRFDEYQLDKWDREAEFSLRDIVFLCHVKPKNEDHARLIANLVNKSFFPKKLKASGYELMKKLKLQRKKPLMKQAETHERLISATKGDRELKKAVWSDLLQRNKVGSLALLRNLRNIQNEGVSDVLLRKALANMKVDRVLPYRFVTAARYAPRYESVIEKAMFRCLEGIEKLPGETVLLVDVSGSMNDQMGAQSRSYRGPKQGREEEEPMTRMDAACGLAILAREICEKVWVFAYSNDVKAIPDRRGFALRDAIVKSMPHGGTYLGKALQRIEFDRPGHKADRVIVFTDEQSHDAIKKPAWAKRAYCFNVAPYQHGVTYKEWYHIDGFSEASLRYVAEIEKQNL